MARRNPILAALLNLLAYPFPVGYLYARAYWRGLAVFFLIFLIQYPFIADFTEAMAAVNVTGNETDDSSGNISAGNPLENASITDLFSEDFDQQALLGEVTDYYEKNPWLTYLHMFLRFLVTLDVYMIARPKPAKPKKKKEDSGGSDKVKTEAPPEKASKVFPINIDVRCPRCKIGLAMHVDCCPNCGATLKADPEKKE